jgi:hypothetical protein
VTNTLNIRFKSIPSFWTAEESGAKPNTVRIMDVPPLDFTDTRFEPDERTITMVNSRDGREFTRTLTDVSVVGDLLGKVLVVWSWRP